MRHIIELEITPEMVKYKKVHKAYSLGLYPQVLKYLDVRKPKKFKLAITEINGIVKDVKILL